MVASGASPENFATRVECMNHLRTILDSLFEVELSLLPWMTTSIDVFLPRRQRGLPIRGRVALADSSDTTTLQFAETAFFIALYCLKSTWDGNSTIALIALLQISVTNTAARAPDRIFAAGGEPIGNRGDATSRYLNFLFRGIDTAAEDE